MRGTSHRPIKPTLMPDAQIRMMECGQTMQTLPLVHNWSLVHRCVGIVQSARIQLPCVVKLWTGIRLSRANSLLRLIIDDIFSCHHTRRDYSHP